METSYKIIVAGKEISLNSNAIDLLFADLVKTMIAIIPEMKTGFINTMVSSLKQEEQIPLLDEMEDERIYPLGCVVKG
jgi:hypothetical protein